MTSKVYIEYHSQDKMSVDVLVNVLKDNGVNVSNGFFQKMRMYEGHAKNILKENDFIIWVLSKNTSNFDFLVWYFSEIHNIETSEERRLLLLVFIDTNIPLFDFLVGRVRFLLIDGYSTDKYDDLVHTIQKNAGQRFFNSMFRENAKLEAMQHLGQAYADTNLVLFCGAGISMGSGIPLWNELLISLFIESSHLPSSYTKVLYEMLNKDMYLNQSILARMVKNSNEDNFSAHVQKILYVNKQTDETSTIRAIVELCVPSKNGGVKSIVTYNFDDLLECNLKNKGVKYQNCPTDNPLVKGYLPIYHVHGFLPRILEDRKIYPIVFSEDEYHKEYSKFFDSATSTQLTFLENSTCLYVGVSFTDPNMRRVADAYINNHKNCKKKPRHYLIKRRPRSQDRWDHSLLSQNRVLEQIMFLEEQDAESFGLTILWIDEFSEISQLFNDIKHHGNIK